MHILLYVCMKMCVCVYMNELSIYKAHLYIYIAIYCVLLFTLSALHSYGTIIYIIQSYTVYIHYIAKSIGSPPSNEQVWLL